MRLYTEVFNTNNVRSILFENVSNSLTWFFNEENNLALCKIIDYGKWFRNGLVL
jgi:hypothetical protein